MESKKCSMFILFIEQLIKWVLFKWGVLIYAELLSCYFVLLFSFLLIQKLIRTGPLKREFSDPLLPWHNLPEVVHHVNQSFVIKPVMRWGAMFFTAFPERIMAVNLLTGVMSNRQKTRCYVMTTKMLLFWMFGKLWTGICLLQTHPSQISTKPFGADVEQIHRQWRKTTPLWR